MQRGESARELLRASATDAVAARQLLAAMDADELDGLLDGISRRDGVKKAQADAAADDRSRDDWLALAHALLQCDKTRLRAATRVVQVLWTGAASELEAMQLLTELALGYALALDDAGDSSGTGRQLRRRKLRGEVDRLLAATYRLVGEAVADTELRAKALPQLLGLVPSLLGLLAELAGDAAADPADEDAVHEKLVGLLELPWTVRTLPFLLDVLKDSASFVAPAGWQLLQENVRQMVAPSVQIPAEALNLVLRECVSVADVTHSTQWIDIARFLLRRLPVQSRQEAEFNLQMCLHQSQSLVELVTLAIRDAATSSGDSSRGQPERVDLDTRADWHDLIFLLHALQASKPILHHRSSSLRVARESAVFKDIEDLAWRICVDDVDRGDTASHALLAMRRTDSQLDDRAAEAHMNDRVSKVINFGGKQAYAREWKALLLMDVALFWVDQTSSALLRDSSTKETPGDCRTKRNLSQLVLLAIFHKAPEAQNEILRSLFERCQQPSTAKVSSEVLRKLFDSHPQSLHCHLNAIQDWLGVHFHSSFQSAEMIFEIASRLSMHHRGLFNFLMVFLRKLLSTNNHPHQQFAINLWCTWLESGFRFDEQQEEEILAAIKSGFVVCAAIRPWSMGRLEQVFRCNSPLQVRPASQADLHQFLYHEVSRFVRPTARHRRSNIHSDDESESEDDDEHPSGLRFDFCSLDEFYLQDSSPQGAATAGQLFHRALSCLLAFESAALTIPGTERPLARTGGGEEGTAIRRWVASFVSNQDLFFHWVCRSTEQSSGASSKRSVWDFLARMFIASALCTVAVHLMLEQHRAELQGAPRKASKPNVTSVWSVMEMEFCVHRMIRKTLQESEKKMAWAVPRTISSTLHFGLARALQPHASTLLLLLHQAVASHSGPQEVSSKAPGNAVSGISFDEFVFVLNLFTQSDANADKQSSRYQRSTSDGQDNRAVLETLLLLYRELADCLRAQALQQLPPTSSRTNDGARLVDATHVPSMVFAVYTETMAMKVPVALRHLTAVGGLTGGAVILDGKAGDELLGRICAALGKTVVTLIQSSSAADVQQKLFVLLQTSCWSSVVVKSEHGSIESGNSFAALARALLGDIEFLLASGELTKWSMGAATLCKRLCDVPGALIDATARDELSGQAAQMLCDHAVHQVPLLRLLLAISFLSLPFQFADGDSDPVVDLLQNTLRACGYSFSFDHEEDSSPTIGGSLLAGSKRKRLRQSAGSSEMSDADSDADIFPSSRSGCVPHLVSSAAQNVALGAVITLTDRFASSLVGSLGWGNRPAKSTPSERRQMASVLVRVLDLLRRTIFSSRDLSWIMAKVLVQTLSIVEATLRIGNNCARMSDAKDDATASAHAVEVFDCATRCAAQSRRWIAWVKEASSDSSSKTRLSATALKVDIFLLKVPTKAQTLLKKKMPRESVTRLKSLVLMVKSSISTTHQDTEKPGQGKAKARFVDVVPIVRKRRKRLRSRHPIIDAFLHEEDGDDAYADLEDFIE